LRRPPTTARASQCATQAAWAGMRPHGRKADVGRHALRPCGHDAQLRSLPSATKERSCWQPHPCTRLWAAISKRAAASRSASGTLSQGPRPQYEPARARSPPRRRPAPVRRWCRLPPLPPRQPRGAPRAERSVLLGQLLPLVPVQPYCRAGLSPPWQRPTARLCSHPTQRWRGLGASVMARRGTGACALDKVTRRCCERRRRQGRANAASLASRCMLPTRLGLGGATCISLRRIRLATQDAACKRARRGDRKQDRVRERAGYSAHHNHFASDPEQAA
jgi:hypothetical protein